MTELENLLESLGLARYAAVFAEQDVDLDAVRLLEEHDFDRMGIPIGPRRRLLAALGETGRPTGTGTGSSVTPAAPTAERRQLTVLFCDLVGSTALSQRLDPEELRALMGSYQTTCRAVVERYAGQVAQYLGDGVMAYFGWPVAHEDDAERALRAGLELVAAVKRVSGAPEALGVRSGVATGAVVEAGLLELDTSTNGFRLKGPRRPGASPADHSAPARRPTRSGIASTRAGRSASGCFSRHGSATQLPWECLGRPWATPAGLPGRTSCSGPSSSGSGRVARRTT